MVAWLRAAQDPDGSFKRIGMVHHQDMMGGVAGSTVSIMSAKGGTKGSASLCAFVLGALLEVQDLPSDAATSTVVERASAYLDQHVADPLNPIRPTSKEVYTLTQRAYVAARRVEKGLGERAQTALVASRRSLAIAAQQSGVGSSALKFWGAPASSVEDRGGVGGYDVQPGSARILLGRRPSTSDVETTAYAVLSLLGGGIANMKVPDAFSAIRWLLHQRNSRGAFGSTQDTVVGLQAISEYAMAASNRAPDAVLTASSAMLGTVPGSTPWTATVSQLDYDVLKAREFLIDEALGDAVNISATGTGSVLVTVGLQYNVPPSVSDSTQGLWLRVGYGTPGETTGQHIRACMARDSNARGGNMMLAQIGLFTGFVADVTSVRALVSTGSSVKRVEANGKSVSLYLDDLAPGASPLCVNFTATRDISVGKLQPAVSTLTDYYAPETSGSAISLQVAARADGSGGTPPALIAATDPTALPKAKPNTNGAKAHASALLLTRAAAVISGLAPYALATAAN